MQKLTFTTTILLLFISCTVTKQKTSDNALSQQRNENYNKTELITQAGKSTEKEGETNKNTISPSAKESEIKKESIVSFATTPLDKKVILERLKSELLPQTSDYNPYKYDRENFIISCLEVRVEWENDKCVFVEKFIKRFYELDSTASDWEIQEIVNDISLFRCKEAHDFLETQIKNNPSETVRCNAIIFLAWSLNPDYLPCILEYAKRDSLSVQEKLALGSAFMIYGVYTSNSDLKEKSAKFLDAVCYDFSLDIYVHCDACYLKLGGKAAINFYTLQFELQKGSRKIAEALNLAILGEYEKTFLVFEDVINNGGVGIEIIYAIKGLATIGTKEALRLIETQSQSKNEMIAKEAQKVFENLEKERR